MQFPLHKRLVAEALGTYGLVFAGTSAIVVNSGGAVSHVGVADGAARLELGVKPAEFPAEQQP